MEGIFLADIVLLENILDGLSPPAELSLSFLKYMTDGFSEERVIGRGGFGVVYKGELKNRNIAVKKITFSNNAEKDFDREIGSLMIVNHKNIVRFLGYCNRRNGTYDSERHSFVYKEERILCFEFISNGSLSDHIHDELRGLEWHTRYKIIKEICHALDYLHNQNNLVHRDLKPDNILVDNLMLPKIADLGISKLLGDGVSKAMTTNASMSWGYTAPEFKDREVSFKYDIFSLGVIIIELVTGVRENPDVKNVLTRWRHRWNKTNVTPRYQQVAKCIEIGISCKNDRSKKRPSISKIIKELDGVDGPNGAVGQEIPWWNEVLWVEPPELFFPFQINKQISCSLELHNESSDAHMAFFIKTDSQFEYRVDPEKGVVQPCSHVTVNISLLAQEEAPEKMLNADEFTVKSTRVTEGQDITKEIFSKKSGNIVDKLRVGVVFDAEFRAPCTVEEEEAQSLGARDVLQLVIKSNETAPLREFKQKVMLEITGGDYTSDRPGLDLVAVVDVIYDTYGSNMTKLRAAMMFVLGKLSPIDRISLVTYNSSYQLVPIITDDDKTELERHITYSGNKFGQKVDVMDMLRIGMDVLASRKVDESSGRVTAIMLMSDGKSSYGDATEQVTFGSVPVYTFGLGVGCNPTLLSAIAAKSLGGTFSHVRETDGNTSVPSVMMAFSQWLAGMLTVSVQELELNLAAIGDVQTEIVKVTAGNYPQKQEANGSVTISFGDLYRSEVRNVIVDLLLPAIHSGRPTKMLRATYSYRRRSSSSGSGGGSEAEQFVAPPKTLTLWRTDVAEEKLPPPELQAEEARLNIANAIKEARTMADLDKMKDARAKLFKAHKTLVEKSNPHLRTELHDLLLLFTAEDDYRKMGLPYALSSESSHDRQRFAARGETVRLYATPHMDKYLEQAKKFLKNPDIPPPSSVEDDAH